MSIPLARRLQIPASQRRALLLGLLFVSPWLIGFLLWTVYPLVASIYYSFTRYDLMRPPTFLGLGNYREILFRDRDFRNVVSNTIYWVGLSAPLGVASAFVMASLLNTRILGRSVFRAIFFVPSIVPMVVVAMVWQWLYNMQYGAINASLIALGLPTVPFLTNPTLVKPSLILIHVWTQGSAMVIFLATLQDVPRSLYEAATMDGANAWHRFWNVTVPMCSPVILFNLVVDFIYGFQYFTLPWLMTQGGPSKATEFYALHLYRNAFMYLRMGKASAMGWLLFVAVIILTALLFRVSGRFVYYGGE